MSKMLAALLLAAAPAALAAPGPNADRVKQEQDKLAGTWAVVSVEAGGVRLPAKDVKGFKLIFKGETFTAAMGEQKQEGTVKLDPSRQPRAMDIVHKTGPNKGKTEQAIYLLAGDTLRICGAEAGKDRPTDFSTVDKPGYTLLVLRRQP
jgi:uncharacterized protein (TIGR03067 family)